MHQGNHRVANLPPILPPSEFNLVLRGSVIFAWLHAMNKVRLYHTFAFARPKSFALSYKFILEISSTTLPLRSAALPTSLLASITRPPPHNLKVEMNSSPPPLSLGRKAWSLTANPTMAVGMASKAADEEARAEVEVLNSRLEKTRQLNLKISASLSRLESNGKSMQDAIGPIYGNTQKLQIFGNSMLSDLL
jgi:hypothetical protein